MSETGWLLAGLSGLRDKHVPIDLHGLRPLTTTETSTVVVPAPICARVTRGSEYLAFERARDRLIRFAFEARDTYTTVGTLPDDRDIEDLFRNWLTAMREFQDATPHWLSQRFGKQSDALARFRKALNDTFDSNFAYRLADAIRNGAQHRGVVGVTVGADDGGAEIRLNRDRILSQYRGKFRAATRDEWLAGPDLLSLPWLVAAATDGCQYAQAVVIDSIRDRLEPEVDLVLSLHQEVVDKGHEQAVYMPDDLSTLAHNRNAPKFTWKHNPHPQAERCRELLAKVPAVVAAGPVQVTAEQMTQPLPR
jgi:hypothetical protein